MIGLANLALLGGVVAAAAPVLIHIAHRRRFRTLHWGAMRFLLDLLQARRRRLALEHWLLLAVRSFALLLLALALCRPYLERSLPAGPVVERGGAVAAVLLVDDSLSSGAGRGERALDQCKRLADAYLSTLSKGDEISIIAMSRLGAPVADPIFDVQAARSILAELEPTAVSSDIPALLDAGVEQLGRHVNPTAELVLISDGGRDGWQVGDSARWEDLRRKLSAPAGGRAAPRIVLLSPAVATTGGNTAITGISVDRSLIPLERPVGIRVSIAHVGETMLDKALVRLAVDGRAVGEQALRGDPGRDQQLLFTHAFAEAGSHLVEAWIEGARDQLPYDDRRTIAVEVEQAVPVLLVEGKPGEGLDGSLGYVAAALDPLGDGEGLFAVTRVSAASFRGEHLDGQRVVVLGDVPALDAASVAALESFVVSGGGILVAPGPETDLAMATRYWSRGGHGFLPVPLLRLVEAEIPPLPSSLSLGHPGLSAFGARSHEAWRSARIGRYVAVPSLAATEGGVERLVGLSNGDPLVVERGRGHGRVVLITTSLDLSWSDLPRTVAFVPLVRGLIGHLAAVLLPPRNLAPGERITWLPPATLASGAALTGPGGVDMGLAEGTWEGRRALLSVPAVDPGGYTLRIPGGPTVRFAIAPEPSESRLEPIPETELVEALHGLPSVRFTDPMAIAQTFGHADGRTIELWRILLVGCIALLFIETWLTRRQAA